MAVTLPDDFIRSSTFDKLLNAAMTTLSATIYDSAATGFLSVIDPKGPSARPDSIRSSAADLMPKQASLLEGLIVMRLREPLCINFDRYAQHPLSLASLTPLDVFHHPYKLSRADRAKLDPSSEILRLWAAGKVLACLYQHRDANIARLLVNRRDTLPLTGMHLLRCQVALAHARRRANLAPIDAATGRPMGEKRSKVLTSFTPSQKAGAPSALEKLDRDQNLQLIRDNRAIIKQVLKQFNTDFLHVFKREPSRDEKEILRVLYVEYKQLKQFLPDDEDDDVAKGAAKRPDTAQAGGKRPAGDGLQHAKSASSGSLTEDAVLARSRRALATVREAKLMLQKPIPAALPKLKAFKKEIQKCLFDLKEQYEATHTEVSAFRQRNGRYPGDLTGKWAQPCIDTYHLLYSAYEKIKQKIAAEDK